MYRPPHEANDESKVRDLIDAYRSGAKMNPIVVIYETEAITGSHRIEALRRIERSGERVDWDEHVEHVADEEWSEVMEYYAGEWVDHECLCSRLYDITADDGVRSALEDQR